jgi:DedD protein
MANDLSDEELQFRRRARRRLVGAVVLVVVMVAVLPMVLDDKPRPVNQDIAITMPSTSIPAKDASEFTSKIVPMPPAAKPAAEGPAGTPEAKPEQKPAPAQVEAARPEMPVDKHEAQKAAAPAKPAEQKPETKAVAAKAAKPAETKSEVTKPKEGYVVRLGAFADSANARKRLADLKAKGVKAYAETVKTPGGEKTRVRAGPYGTQAEAEKVRDKLKTAKIDGDVVNLATEAGH